MENQNTLALHPQWVAGFTSGDGSFKVNIRESEAYKVGGRVAIIFVLTQHIRDELLIRSLVNFFGCGQSYSYKDYTEFKCQTFRFLAKPTPSRMKFFPPTHVVWRVHCFHSLSHSSFNE